MWLLAMVQVKFYKARIWQNTMIFDFWRLLVEERALVFSGLEFKIKAIPSEKQ